MRWAFPSRDIVALRDCPREQWPARFHGTVVYGIFPSCVLIESHTGTQLLRVYPGKSAGESTIYLTQGSTTPIRDAEQLQRLKTGMQAACAVLSDEDFPMSEACQRGLESGVDHVVFGRNEPLLQHLAASWERGLINEQLANA